MIFPPWLFFAWHFVQGYALADALGKMYGSAAKYLAHLLHIWVGFSEHLTLAVPFFDYYSYKYNFPTLLGVEQLVFLYLAYCNPSEVNEKKKKNKRRLGQLFVANVIMVFFFVALEFGTTPNELVYNILGIGPPVPMTPESMLKLFESAYYNAGHFCAHSFFSMSIVLAISYAQFDTKLNSIRTGLDGIRSRIKKNLVIFMFGWSVLVLVLAVAIANWDRVNILPDNGAPFLPPLCKTTPKDDDECTFLGITIPCHKTFSSDATKYFGFNFEMSHIWTFSATFILGAIYLWITPCQTLSKDTVKRYSLHITCALYAMVTSFFSLFRMFLGVSLPLLGKYYTSCWLVPHVLWPESDN